MTQTFLAEQKPVDAPDPAAMADLVTFTIDGEVSASAILATVTRNGERAAAVTFSPAERAKSLAPAVPAAERVVALDVLEHVVDEESWLAAFAALLPPGGELVVRVPLEGPLAWLDALNMYRYVQDITGWGKTLEETKMKGWHRHYRETDVRRMIAQAGFQVTRVERSGSPHLEAAHFAALAWRLLVQGEPDAERPIKAWRDEAERGMRLPRLGPASTKLTVRATRLGEAPVDHLAGER